MKGEKERMATTTVALLQIPFCGCIVQFGADLIYLCFLLYLLFCTGFGNCDGFALLLFLYKKQTFPHFVQFRNSFVQGKKTRLAKIPALCNEFLTHVDILSPFIF